MRLLALYLMRSRAALAASVLFGLVSGLSTAYLLALINRALASQAPDEHWGWIFAGVCLIRLSSGIAAHVLLIRLAQEAICRLRLELCDKILNSPLRHLEQTGGDRLVASFTDDVMVVGQAVVNLPYFLINIIILIGCLGYLGLMSATVLAGVLIFMVFGVLTYLAPVLWAHRYLTKARDKQDQLFSYFGDLVRGIKELKLSRARRDSFLNHVLEPSAESVKTNNVTGITIYAAAANWNRLLFFIYVGLLILAMPQLSSWTFAGATGDARVHEAPQLAGYILVLLYMMAPLEAIQNALPHLARANVALSKIDKLGLSLVTAAEAKPVSTPARLDGWRRICLRAVHYGYNDGSEDTAFQLGPLDLEIRRNEVIYLTGGNGSGKTTLVKLLTGLYSAGQGDIYVDNHLIDDHLRPEFRQIFSAVFADCHLFQELFGLDPAGLDDRANNYLRELGLDHKLAVEQGHLSTVELSAGQRKRLALLTALLEDRDVYVLDEWAADQDPSFREIFYRRVIPGLQKCGKTVVVATHDDRYFHLADRLLKLDCGAIVEDCNVAKAHSLPVSPLKHTQEREVVNRP